MVSVTVSSESAALINCRLLDNTGKLLSSTQTALHKGVNTITINNLGNLGKGLYFLQVQTGDVIQTTKIIK